MSFHHVIFVAILAFTQTCNASSISEEDIMANYFAAVQSHAVAPILDVFAPDAKIITSKKQIVGHSEIAEFYLNGVLACAEFKPEPGPLFKAGPNTIAVEIVLNCDNQKKSVGDFFTFANGKITEMRVYSGPNYQP